MSFLLAFVLTGCAGATGTAANRSGFNALDEATIRAEAAPGSDVRDLLERLRPQWLRARGQMSLQDESAGYPIVYVDGVRHGAVDSLRGLQATGVTRIEFISAADATTRYGTGHLGGAILISFRPGGAPVRP